MEIELSGYKVQIDEEDWERLKGYKWSPNKKKTSPDVYFRAHYYLENGVRSTISLHRLVMGCTYGDGKMVDHIDHNTLDNRKSNLRICDAYGNNQNRRSPSINTLGYKGIRVSTGDNRWGAVVSFADKNIRTGTYTTPEEAARAYDMICIKLQGEFACTNFPREQYTEEEIEQVYSEAMAPYSCNNKAGYRGVCKHTRNNAWVSSICYKRETIYIGSFSSAEDAAVAYDKKALELLGDKAKLNFPKDSYTRRATDD